MTPAQTTSQTAIARATSTRGRVARPTARTTGLAYLGIVLCGLFAEFVVRMSLVSPGDAVATAESIAASPWLFGSGIGADVVMIALDVTVAFGLYRLLRHVDERLALVATVARLVQAAVLTANLVNPLRALGHARDAVAGVPGAADAALGAMETHALVYDVGLIAFAVSCLAVARLLSTTGVVPRLLWLGMAATGVVYLVGSLAAVFAPTLSAAIDPFYLVAIVVEPAFALWLVLRGRRLEPTTAPAPAHTLA
ncbi:DUF4386 domain-containing protein [Salsipaludibacter albus]|uniref:DUF4386 domain-containing protein n=1 Tax=Salsipaludibacter albus TaxID=2849650 RepID=UPI001EE3DC4A|nr:DUF4386 domain-containing protein [Salsipaludibacter albus]MBY5163644.1 DUF4386 domain-containing protein [Salsipaludibacter albus]